MQRPDNDDEMKESPIEQGFRPRQMRFWKKLAWEFGWDFKFRKTEENRWVFHVSKEVDGTLVSQWCMDVREAVRWYAQKIKIPTKKEQRAMLEIFDDLESAPREWPYED